MSPCLSDLGERRNCFSVEEDPNEEADEEQRSDNEEY